MKRFTTLLITTIVFSSFIYNNAHAQCSAYTTISAAQHTLALKSDGSLWAWGYNYYGQLGDGTSGSGSYKNVPVQIGSETWRAISAGTDHSLAIKSDGSLWAWGFNGDGRLGDGTHVDKNVPTLIDAGNWKVVSVKGATSFAIKSDNTLWGCGENNYGQLGDGTNISKQVFTQIGADYWKSVCAAGIISFGIKADGTIMRWGYGHYFYPSSFFGDMWESVVSGGDRMLGIRSDGTLWSWSSYGEFRIGLGLGEYIGPDVNSVDWREPRQIGTDRWRAVSMSTYVSMAIKYDGTLWAWGDSNLAGEFGDGTKTGMRSTPQLVNSTKWKAIASGISHQIGIREDGSLNTWGLNNFGQLGNGGEYSSIITTPTSIYVPTYSNILALSGNKQTILGGFLFRSVTSNDCNPIVAIQQAAGSANGISSTVTAKVWVQTTPPSNYVKRHYEITPAENAATATAWVTLYFTNQEFKDFNAQTPAPSALLPDADDPSTLTARKANVLIEKRGGASSDNSGLPATYSGSIQTINPEDDNIVWNATYSRWEVTFNVTGFSGFFVKTQSAALLVTFGNISAIIKSGSLYINFTSLAETNNDRFLIEASADGKNFTEIGTLKSAAKDGNSDAPLQYQFSINTNAAGITAMLGFGLFAALCFASKRNRKLFAGIAVVCAFVLISCNKTGGELNASPDGNFYIRIAQVDKNGTKEYSKVVKVVKE